MTFRYQHGDRPLEGYTILRGIGRGGFGEVYYAVSDGGREVALKVIQQHHDVELRGINHCMNLKNPHLVSIFDVKSNEDGVPFVIMEYVAGPSIRDILREAPGGLGAEKAAYLVREIGKGLTYLHDRGIVHRDLKPENIFYEDGYVKIGDYGLSKYISVSRQSGQTISVGTVHYMAPEIGSGNYHHGIDIYALGVIFFELLTGNVPFNGDSMGEILMKHLTCEPDLSCIEEPFRPVIAKALAKNPKDRHASTAEMVDALLRAGDISRRIAGFDPSSLSRCTIHITGEPAEAIPRPAQRPFSPQKPVLPPPLPGTAPAMPMAGAAMALGAAGAAPAMAAGYAQQSPLPAARPQRAAETSLAPIAARDMEHRLVHGLVTILAMSCGLGLLTRGRMDDIWAFAFLIGGASAAVCFVECWWVNRFPLGPGVLRRLVTFGHGIPVLLLAKAIFDMQEAVAYVMMAGFLLIDWSLRAKPARLERVSFNLSFLAGLVGLVVAAMAGCELLLGAGLLAAMSLAIGALAPFRPELRKSRQRKAREALEAARPPAPAPAAGGMFAAHGPPAAAFAGPEAPIGAPGSSARPGSARIASLYRPLDDRVIGGVCSGLARRYGWEVALLRAGIVIFTLMTGGLGFLAYIVLWISMPGEPARPKLAAPSAAPVSASGRGSRSFLGTAIMVLGLVFLAILGGLFFVRLGVGGGTPRIGVAWMALVVVFAVATVVGIGAVSLFRKLGPSTAERPRAAPGASDALTTSPGWAALGALFVALAAIPVALGTAVTSGLGDQLVAAESGIPMDVRIWIQGFGRHGEHLAIGLLVFVPGVFFMLLGRRGGGPGHVIRGALGWLFVAVMVSVLAILAPDMIRSGALVPGADGVGTVVARPLFAVMLFLLFLGITSAVCLAWPRKKPERPPEPFALVEEPEAAGRT